MSLMWLTSGCESSGISMTTPWLATLVKIELWLLFVDSILDLTCARSYRTISGLVQRVVGLRYLDISRMGSFSNFRFRSNHGTLSLWTSSSSYLPPMRSQRSWLLWIGSLRELISSQSQTSSTQKILQLYSMREFGRSTDFHCRSYPIEELSLQLNYSRNGVRCWG